MAHWEQYEVWVQNGGKWEKIASFKDFEVASSVARNRSRRVRLIHAVYEGEKVVTQDVLVELGVMRENNA